MERDRFCDACLVKCWFRVEADNIAADTEMDPADKSRKIAELRVEARGRECPNLNNIDPYYPGKEKL